MAQAQPLDGNAPNPDRVALAIPSTSTLRALALGFGFAHLAAAVISALTLLMLYGDGSWFVYALTLGDPWELKWRDIAARATTYVATVIPTEIVTNLFHLSPLATARLNGLIFYGAPGLLFAMAASMAWRRQPAALYFLVLQALCGFAIGYGFPSEILLAPGFLWIALISLRAARPPSPIFFLAYTATLFTHELALPAALVAAYYAWRRSGEGESGGAVGRAGLAILLAAPVVAMVVVRHFGGGEGSNTNAIFAVDPRRVLNNPTLWLCAALAPVVYLLARRFRRLRSPLGLGLFALASLLLTLMVAVAFPALNFADGRYDGRSLIALSMVVLAALYVRTSLASPDAVSSTVIGWSLPLIGGAMGVVLASTALFLADWTLAVDGMLKVVAPSRLATSVEFISVDQALERMAPKEAEATRRMHFYWVVPYRSFVLADGRTPGRVIVGDGDYKSFCTRSYALKLSSGPYPPSAFNEWRAFSCRYVRPARPDTMSKRLLRKLKALLK